LLAAPGQILKSAPGQGPAGQDSKTGETSSEQPPIPVEEIIRKFAAKEEAFKAARENYTYKQYVRVQEYTPYGAPGGEYVRKSEIVFTPEGERYEHVTYEPPATLKQISISPEDQKDLVSIQPFVLTTEDLPKYNLEYRGHEQVDEISAYVFQVAPKAIEKGERYFQGTIWVDDRDLQIVKTRGKAVPDIHGKNSENLFPEFETYREQIDGHYWFPTYTRADDVLHFKNGDVRIRVIIRYTDYKQYRVTTRIRTAGPVEPDSKKPPEN
jgi:hypothetical protein